MKINILGCYAATPRTLTNTTSQVLEIKNHLFLIDCAEGTQMLLRKHKIKFSKINHLFISHLHGDHFFGLIGLISTFALFNRENTLYIYGPVGLKEIITLQLKLTESYAKFPIEFIELSSKSSEIIFEDDKVVVKTIPLKHRIYCNGYLFEEKPGDRRLNLDAIYNYEIDPVYFNKIKQGKDITLEDGTLVANKTITFEPNQPKSYAFCSDTAYNENIVEVVNKATVMYHESTFLEKDLDLAKKTKHSTAKQAAKIAQMAKVEHLILGHFSTRYPNLDLFITEAKEFFEQVSLADDGKIFEF